jgi:RNA polymerase sigma-70 factor (ECF subfamily)
MQDDRIVSLYWKRDETAISETEQKYGKYLSKIAYHVLSNQEDSKESVNDTYLKAWNSMPPHKPSVLSTYLGRITRQTSIDLFRKRNSDKRLSSEYAVSLSELEECISTGDVTEQSVDVHLLAESISRFLRSLSPEASSIFVMRYYFMDSIREIADSYGMSQSKVKSMLHRTRIALKNHLEQEGFTV